MHGALGVRIRVAFVAAVKPTAEAAFGPGFVLPGHESLLGKRSMRMPSLAVLVMSLSAVAPARPDILQAATGADPEISLLGTDEVYRCAVVGLK